MNGILFPKEMAKDKSSRKPDTLVIEAQEIIYTSVLDNGDSNIC